MVAILNSAYVGFRHCLLGFRYLVIFCQIHSKTLSFHSDSDSNLFNLINLMMAAILNSAILYSAILDSAILHKTLTQTNLIWLKLIHSHSTCYWQPSWIQPFCTKKTLLIYSHSCDDGSHLEFCHLGLSHFAQNKLYSFIVTQLDDGSHLEFCHVRFIHCHLGFRHLVIFSQIHSKTLSLHSDSDSN